MCGLAPAASPSTRAGALWTSITTATQARAGRNQSTRPDRVGSRAGNHPRDEVGNGFGRSDPDIPVDRGESLGEGSTLGAGGEMLVGDSGLVGVRFAVESGREHVADVVAIHVGKVGGGGDLVPIVRHCNLSWIT